MVSDKIKSTVVFGIVLLIQLILIIIYFLARYTSTVSLGIKNSDFKTETKPVIIDVIVTLIIVLTIGLTIWAWKSSLPSA